MLDICPTCEVSPRETVGMVCPTCGKDYNLRPTPPQMRLQSTNSSWDPETGLWVEAVPMGPQGPIAKLEFWLRDRGWKRLSNFLGRIDEIGL